MRIFAILFLAALCGACAGGPAGGPSPVGGMASYDALKRTRDACVARGGELTQLPETTGKRLADYGCKRK